MKNITKTVSLFAFSLVFILIIIGVSVKTYAAVVTPAFPGVLNLFEEGDIIEEEDWNAIEIRIGETGTTTRSTLTFQVNDLMATTSMAQVTTLLGLTSTGALNAGSITSGFGAINIGADDFTTTGFGRFGNLLLTSSTTLQNFTAGNSTTTNATSTNSFATNATTTNSFSTTASSTNLATSLFTGAGLVTCSGTNFLQWTGGSFNCQTGSASTLAVTSTTSVQNLATTTCSIANGCLPNTTHWVITFVAPNYVGSGTTTNQVYFGFNGDFSAKYGVRGVTDAASLNVNTRQGVEVLDNANDLYQKYIEIRMPNVLGKPAMGSFDALAFGTSTPGVNLGAMKQGVFVYNSIDAITSIDFGSENPDAYFGTSTVIQVIGY